MGDNVPIEPVGGDAGDGEEEEEEWDEEEWDEDDFDYEEELDVWDGALDLADDGFSESEEDSEYESMEEDEDVQSLFNSNMPGAGPHSHPPQPAAPLRPRVCVCVRSARPRLSDSQRNSHQAGGQHPFLSPDPPLGYRGPGCQLHDGGETGAV
mmetsp:Transcript_6671/g.18620  ORF Transcript_6671/g.18620 Transcript_6671/m.18620 type:complete len:153 (-) Transcript_6671:1973-2431(-)